MPYNMYTVHFPCSRRTLLSFVTFVLLCYRMLLPVSAICGRSPFLSGNLAMGASFSAQPNDYVQRLHALVAKTADTPLAQGARCPDSVTIEYTIIYMQKVARRGWRGTSL